MINVVLGRLVQVTRFSGIARSLSFVFGVARGVMLMLILVAFAGFIELSKQKILAQCAVVVLRCKKGVHELKPLLHETLALTSRADVSD